MKPEVEEALANAARLRAHLLQSLSLDERIGLLNDLLVDFFVEQWRTLLKWAGLTGQSSQVDTGYIAQHIASILLGQPGQGFKGKGLDLLDGSEVKSAAIISGVDRPRWNHNMGTLAQDVERQTKGRLTTSEEYLSSPNVFYLLFDRVIDADGTGLPLVLRVRGWCVNGLEDYGWRDLVLRYLDTRSAKKYNLQLHPPVGYDDDIVVNTLGNLDFSDVKVFEARIHGMDGSQAFHIDWVKLPPEAIAPVTARTRPLPYGGRNDRPSRLTQAADIMPDAATLQELLPDHDITSVLAALNIEASVDPD